MVTDQQVRRLITLRNKEKTLSTAASKPGIIYYQKIGLSRGGWRCGTMKILYFFRKTNDR